MRGSDVLAGLCGQMARSCRKSPLGGAWQCVKASHLRARVRMDPFGTPTVKKPRPETFRKFRLCTDLTLSTRHSRRRRALPAAKRRTGQNSTVALSLCVERCPLHPPGPCARLASASASASNILRICSKVRQTARSAPARPVRSTSELENNARTSTTRTGFVGPVGLMVPRAVAWPASVAVGSGSLVPRRVPREVEMKKGRLRKRGNPEAARRALAAATSGESSAAQLPRSGLPLGAARARELP